MRELGMYACAVPRLRLKRAPELKVINWIIAFTTPMFLARTSSGPYFLFGSCSLLTTLVCLAFQPETRGASLEEVEKAFQEAPWKAAFRKRREVRATPDTLTEEHELAVLERRQVVMPGHEPSDEVAEIDVIRLPEVRYNGLWHYAS